SIYIAIDWSNDHLVLTNLRVIADDEVLLVRHVQDQLLLSDIQSVNARTHTYLQQWLKYGTITIQSASPGRKLIFDDAAQPGLVRPRIGGGVRTLWNRATARL